MYNVSLSDLADLVLIIPPLAEQKRIVAKIDELMALCDQLEAQHSNAAEAHEKLVSHLLGTLTKSQSADDFNANWQRIAAHFDTLFTTEASIDALKQTLLQLAVMGKLVPQDANDEPASELLQRIQAEKAKLIAEGKLKKEKAIEPISEVEKFFEIPSGWEWVRVGSLGNWGAGATPLRSVSSYYGGTMPWFKSGELIADFIDTAEETVTDLALNDCSLRLNQPGDVLLAMYGATIGKASILKIAGTTNQAVCACTPNGSIFNRYLLLMLKAMKSNFVGQGAGGAQPNISREKIIATLTALPPLAEQHRIVAKVDELMALCDQLKTRIQQANQQQQAIANTLVAQAVQPTAEIINLADYRAATACYAITKMQGKSYFGRTAAMKVLYLAEAHLGLPLNFQPMREAAGPLDKWIYAFEKQGEHEGWFKVIESEIRNGKTKIEYQVKSAIAQKSVLIKKICSGDQLKEFDRLLGLIADKTTEEAEIIATLFAAWNDFLIDGRTPSDDEIVKEVRENWHESKARFTAMQLKESLNWMRRNHLVPKGRQPRTVYQQQLITS